MKIPTTLDKVAIVLGEKIFGATAFIFVASLCGALNITMGYPSKNNPAQILIAKLFKMHTNALARNAKNYVLYYKDVWIF
jgi:hypothetical protein